jgi:hypothetical protein
MRFRMATDTDLAQPAELRWDFLSTFARHGSTG